MSRLLAALLVAVAVQASLASAGLQRRDAVAGPTQFPHQAWLQMVDSLGAVSNCAGALISVKWVLTTASCLQDASSIYVYLGTFYLPEDSPDYHMQYSHGALWLTNKNYDLALVGLRTTPQLNKFVAPIRLPPKRYLNASHFLWKTTVSEYAVSKHTGDQGTDKVTLRYSSHRVEPNFLCRLQYKTFTDFHLCLLSLWPAHTPETCTHYGGSPLIVTESDGKPTLLGLAASFDGTTSSCGTVYTQVATHLDWISYNADVSLRE